MFDPNDESTWTAAGARDWLAAKLDARIRAVAPPGTPITISVRACLTEMLQAFRHEIEMPPRYEITELAIQPDGSVKAIVRDNRPGTDSIVLGLKDLHGGRR